MLFAGYEVYKQIAKTLAIINKDICNVMKRCQESTQLQSQLTKERKELEITHEMKIVNQCTLEV